MQAATSAPLIERSIERATGIVYNITGGSDLTLQAGPLHASCLSTRGSKASSQLPLTCHQKLHGGLYCPSWNNSQADQLVCW